MPKMVSLDESERDRVINKILASIIVSPEGYFIWQRGRDSLGYGHVTVGRLKRMLAHRASWEAFRGPIPEGLLACHTCDNPPCVNPAHLFLGDASDNINDCVKKGRSGRVISTIIAKKFGVHYASIHQIIIGKTFKKVV